MERNVARRIAMMPTAMKAGRAPSRTSRIAPSCGWAAAPSAVALRLNFDHEAEGNDDNARSQARNVRSLAARSA
jgi:hypothetical protein